MSIETSGVGGTTDNVTESDLAVPPLPAVRRTVYRPPASARKPAATSSGCDSTVAVESRPPRRGSDAGRSPVASECGHAAHASPPRPGRRARRFADHDTPVAARADQQAPVSTAKRTVSLRGRCTGPAYGHAQHVATSTQAMTDGRNQGPHAAMPGPEIAADSHPVQTHAATRPAHRLTEPRCEADLTGSPGPQRVSVPVAAFEGRAPRPRQLPLCSPRPTTQCRQAKTPMNSLHIKPAL